MGVSWRFLSVRFGSFLAAWFFIVSHLPLLLLLSPPASPRRSLVKASVVQKVMALVHIIASHVLSFVPCASFLLSRADSAVKYILAYAVCFIGVYGLSFNECESIDNCIRSRSTMSHDYSPLQMYGRRRHRLPMPLNQSDPIHEQGVHIIACNNSTPHHREFVIPPRGGITVYI